LTGFKAGEEEGAGRGAYGSVEIAQVRGHAWVGTAAGLLYSGAA